MIVGAGEQIRSARVTEARAALALTGVQRVLDHPVGVHEVGREQFAVAKSHPRATPDGRATTGETLVHP